MNYLNNEREALRDAIPGLEEALTAEPLLTFEKPGNPAIARFKELGGPGLLIPKDYNGIGSDAVQVARVQRAIGSRSPSLAIATTMHHFSVASVLEMAQVEPESTALMLTMVTMGNLLLASGFAEGRTGAHVLSSQIEVKQQGDNWILSGSKKPCSLSKSMDLLTAGVLIPGPQGEPQPAVAVIPADDEGIERKPFWTTDILSGAESDEIVLNGVTLSKEQVFPMPIEDPGFLDNSFLWFELLITASYLGVASGLVERAIGTKKGNETDRFNPVMETEAAMCSIEGVAQAMKSGERSNDLLGRMLFVRYAVQQAIDRATAQACELSGGMQFIRSPEVAYLLAASKALAFHPPSRSSALNALNAFVQGERLILS